MSIYFDQKEHQPFHKEGLKSEAYYLHHSSY